MGSTRVARRAGNVASEQCNGGQISAPRRTLADRGLDSEKERGDQASDAEARATQWQHLWR